MNEISNFSTVSMVFCLTTVLLIAAMGGFSAGFDAESVEDARIVEGEDYNLTNASSNYEPPEADLYRSLNNQTDTDLPDLYSDEPNSEATEFADTVVRQAMGFASGIAVWTFKNKGWLPKPLIAGGLKLASWGLTAAYTGYVALLMRRIYRRIKQ